MMNIAKEFVKISEAVKLRKLVLTAIWPVWPRNFCKRLIIIGIIDLSPLKLSLRFITLGPLYLENSIIDSSCCLNNTFVYSLQQYQWLHVGPHLLLQMLSALLMLLEPWLLMDVTQATHWDLVVLQLSCAPTMSGHLSISQSVVSWRWTSSY